MMEVDAFPLYVRLDEALVGEDCVDTGSVVYVLFRGLLFVA